MRKHWPLVSADRRPRTLVVRKGGSDLQHPRPPNHLPSRQHSDSQAEAPAGGLQHPQAAVRRGEVVPVRLRVCEGLLAGAVPHWLPVHGRPLIAAGIW